MENFRFLDFRNPEHFFDITLDSVKTTEGINTGIATVVMLGKNTSCDGQESALNMPESLWVTAKIFPTFVTSQNVTLLYDNGVRKFAPIPVFAGNSSKNIVSKIKIVFRDFTHDFLGQIASTSEVLFEKNFPELPSNTELRISSHGTVRPFYSEPIEGTAIPLWCIGGYYNDHCPLFQVESLFVFPVSKGNQEISARIFPFSEIVEKDPDFAHGNSAHFAAVQCRPWSLVSEIERGGAVLRVQCGDKTVTFSSANITKTTILSDEVLIKFIRRK
jgi:hypothetical protein